MLLLVQGPVGFFQLSLGSSLGFSRPGSNVAAPQSYVESRFLRPGVGALDLRRSQRKLHKNPRFLETKMCKSFICFCHAMGFFLFSYGITRIIGSIHYFLG